MTERKKHPLVYEVKLGAPDSAEGRADMARMLRIHGGAMIAAAEELEKDVTRAMFRIYNDSGAKP